MTKQSGLGQKLLVRGYDLSGDIGSLSNISGGPETLPATGIDKEAQERLFGLRTGGLTFMSYFNPSAGQAHPVLGALPTTDVDVMYLHRQVLGNPAACCRAKQLNYDGTRGTDGAFTFTTQVESNGYSLEWGEQATAGLRTDTAATNGSSLDGGAASLFGFQAYLQVLAFTGTSATIKIQSSSDDGAGDAFADVAGASFGAQTAIGTSRLAVTGAVERYLRVVSTGTFTNCVFSVVICRNQAAVVI
jgi:hypothetical protein